MSKITATKKAIEIANIVLPIIRETVLSVSIIPDNNARYRKLILGDIETISIYTLLTNDKKQNPDHTIYVFRFDDCLFYKWFDSILDFEVIDYPTGEIEREYWLTEFPDDRFVRYGLVKLIDGKYYNDSLNIQQACEIYWRKHWHDWDYINKRLNPINRIVIGNIIDIVNEHYRLVDDKLIFDDMLAVFQRHGE